MNKYTDIQQQIRSYHNGELDGPAMHRLEREALNDPFLADALEGYSGAGKDQQANLDDLRSRLQQRAEPATRRIIPWRTLSIAASVIIVLTVGGLLFINNKQDTTVQKIVVANKVEPENTEAEQPQLAPASPQTEAEKEKEVVAAPQVASAQVKQEQYARAKYNAASSQKAYAQKKKPVIAGNLAEAAVDKNISGDTVALEDRIVQGFFMSPTESKESAKSGSGYIGDTAKTTQTARMAGVASAETRSNGYAKSSNTISGKITDINGPLIGANISIAGTNFMTRTDRSGKFTVPDATNKILIVDYLGYQRKRVKVTSRDSLLIALQPDNAALSEVTVVGYSAGKTKTLTGKVIDKDGPIAGVSVSIAGTKAATITDAMGKFNLPVVPNVSVLDVGFVGYETKHVKVLDRDSLTVVMQPNYMALNEVVVVKKAKIKAGEPVNGWAGFNQYIADNALSPDGKTGTVKLSFSVNAGGGLSNFKVIKSLSPKTDTEAINLVKAGPDWQAAANGKAVTVNVSIKFDAEK